MATAQTPPSKGSLATDELVASQTVSSYYISPTDTILRSQRLSEFDNEGRLLRKQDYYYSSSQKGVLVKEETAQYFPAQQLLRENVITYPSEQAPRRQRYETRYLVYAPEDEKSKHIWKRHFDAFGELTREDTITYDANQQMINKCSYNYMGSTSLLCDEYEYKQDSLRHRWCTYSKWTTINGRSQVVERQTKRRDYRYRYNKRGQLTCVKGTDYASKIQRCLCYDPQGRLERDYLIKKRELTSRPKGPDGKPDPKQKKQKTIRVQETFLRYEAGNLVHMEQRVDGQTTHKQIFIYEDSLAIREEIYRDTFLVERYIHEYDDNRHLRKTSRARYAPDGKLRYTLITEFNADEQPILEEQFVGPKRLMQKTWTYNNRGLLIERTTGRTIKRNTFPILEQDRYTYTYHE